MSSASFRAKRNGVSAPKNGLTRNVRLIVPADVQTIALGLPETDTRRALLVHEDGRPKGALIKTTRRRNAEEADGIGEALRREWKAVFASLRAEHKPGGVSQARERIDAWRAEEVAAALGFDVEISLLEYKARAEALASPAAGVEHGGLVWAERYFGERPEASRGPAMPPETFMLLDRLQVIETSPEAWRDIDGFDTVLNAVLGARWAATTRTIGTSGKSLPAAKRWSTPAPMEKIAFKLGKPSSTPGGCFQTTA